MKKYLVHIYEPTVYEVEAENEDEAKKKAEALYMHEKKHLAHTRKGRSG